MKFLDLSIPEKNYKQILSDILKFGTRKTNRTGTDTISLFSTNWNSGDIISSGHMPLLTCRKTYWKGALVELFWILGILQAQNPIPGAHRNNVKYLQREGCKYWDAWADENGDLGPVYGAQLTSWPRTIIEIPEDQDAYECGYDDISVKFEYINQIQNIIDTLRTNPDDRRMICTMWNPSDLNKMALPPCHYCFEFYSRPDEDGNRYLSLRWIQRSCDMPIGIGYDIMMYSFLLIMIAKMTNHIPERIYGSFGDSHVYVNQIDGVQEMINAPYIKPPKLEYTGPEYIENLNDFKLEWFKIVDYNFYKEIPLPVSV